MFQIDDPTAVAVMPTPEAAGTQGYFTEGNPATNTPATNVRASFLNALMKEMMNVLVAGGVTAVKTTYDQVSTAITNMIKALAIGYGQTWQNLTGSRAVATLYTNSTGRTIMVAASVAGNTNNDTCSSYWEVGGVANICAANSVTGATAANTILASTTIVPPGATYKLVVAKATMQSWQELR